MCRGHGEVAFVQGNTKTTGKTKRVFIMNQSNPEGAQKSEKCHSVSSLTTVRQAWNDK